jgi:hypothetical protein
MIITLDSELDNALREVARRQGVAPETLVLNALRQQFLAAAAPDDWGSVDAIYRRLAASARSFTDSADLLREDRER